MVEDEEMKNEIREECSKSFVKPQKVQNATLLYVKKKRV